MAEHQPLLPSHHGSEAALNSSDHPESTMSFYRERTAQALESRALHKLVIALITIDAACVVTDVGYAFLTETCSPSEGTELPEWLEVLARISLVITTMFLLEIPLTMWAIGLQFYNPFGHVHHASLHLFDAFIILSTFTLEVFLRGRERELASLLVLFRLWRLVKLVGGIAVGAGELEAETAKELEATHKKLQESQTALSQALKENEELKKKMKGPEIVASSPAHPS